MAAVSTKRKVLLAAVVLGLFASIMIYKFLLSARDGSVANKITVAITTKRITARTEITPDMVATKEIQANMAPSGACTSLVDVVGRVTLATLPPDTIIAQGMVEEKGIGLGASFVIPNGKRAVSIAVDPVIGVAGFPKPGDHVDVVATYHSGDAAIARTVVQDVELFALGAQVQTDRIPKNDVGPSASGTSKDTATLFVTPAEAERLTLAEVEGKLRLALRPAGDLVHVTTTGAVSPSRPVPHAVPATTVVYRPRDEGGFGKLPPMNVAATSDGAGTEPTKQPVPPQKIQPAKPQIQVIRGIEIQTVEVER